MKRAPLRRVSRRQARRNRVLSERKRELIAIRGRTCEALALYGDALVVADESMRSVIWEARRGCYGIASDLHHLRPRSRGGSDCAHNLLLLCRACHDFATFNPVAEQIGLVLPSERAA